MTSEACRGYKACLFSKEEFVVFAFVCLALVMGVLFAVMPRVVRPAPGRADARRAAPVSTYRTRRTPPRPSPASPHPTCEGVRVPDDFHAASGGVMPIRFPRLCRPVPGSSRGRGWIVPSAPARARPVRFAPG